MNTFRDAIRTKDFVITADLPSGAATSLSDIEADIASLTPFVDAVQAVEDAEAVGNVSALAISAIARQHDCDAVVHMSCRDRNRLALQADLLGAAALGVTSLVLARGEKLPRSDYVRGKGVFDTHETRLMEMAVAIGENPDLVAPPGFLIGTRVSAFNPPEDWQARRISESISAGSRFLYTQPCLNVSVISRYMNRLIAQKIPHRASVIVDVPLITTRDAARDYKERIPDALVPKPTVQRILNAADPLAEGMEICADVLATLQSTSGVAGANISHAGPAEDVVAAIRRAGLVNRGRPGQGSPG